MSLLPALASHLLNNAGVSALVSTRIYPERLPASTSANPNTMPLATYQLLDEPVVQTFDNQPIYKARVQVDAWGGSYKSAHALAAAVYACLEGYKGAMGDLTIDVGGCFRKVKRDQSDPNVELFRVVQEFSINYKEL